MFVRFNKTTKQLDDSVCISDMKFASEYELKEGFEWIDAKSPEVETAILLRVETENKQNYLEHRQNEYFKQGITEKEMVVALWEKVMENRPASADSLQAKRSAIKQLYPKP
jgi:hypothetical protein